MLLSDRIERAIALAPRHLSKVAVLFLDLDGFKAVNDSLGHDVGDQLLSAVALRLTAVDTGGGLVARLGGDQFAMLARVSDSEAANELGLRAVQALREPVTLDGLRVDVTVSVGVALPLR